MNDEMALGRNEQSKTQSTRFDVSYLRYPREIDKNAHINEKKEKQLRIHTINVIHLLFVYQPRTLCELEKMKRESKRDGEHTEREEIKTHKRKITVFVCFFRGLLRGMQTHKEKLFQFFFI